MTSHQDGSTEAPDGLAALDVANLAADAAARIHRSFQGGAFSLGTKSTDTDIVTEIDRLSEEAIRRVIASHYPDHAVLGEEEGQDVDARCRWIVDPLDGTVNFAHGFPFYCVSVALEVDGAVVAGVVLDTANGERFTAALGHGAFVDGRRLHVSTATDPRQALLSTGFAYGGETIAANAAVFARMLPETRALRRAGAAALDLCYVAAGRADGYWEFGVNAWDVAAGMLLIREAGGTVTGPDGSPYRWGDAAMIASNGALHGRLLHLLDLGHALA
ncbi:MAG: inositol monophosphatase [Trueperaceae bacterium]|nr:inositol monophosphatase [Trueperaceae bacterium]